MKECSATNSFFGNNDTRTCVPKCLDRNSFAEDQTDFRVCVSRCLDAPIFRYANNLTKICVASIACPAGYYGLDSTQ